MSFTELFLKFSNHGGDFYCLNRCHSHRTLSRLKEHETLCNNYDYCHVEMPEEHKRILKCRHGEKSLKTPFVISFNTEVLKFFSK